MVVFFFSGLSGWRWRDESGIRSSLAALLFFPLFSLFPPCPPSLRLNPPPALHRTSVLKWRAALTILLSSIPHPLTHTMLYAIVFLPLFGMPFSSHARTIYTSPNFKVCWGGWGEWLRSMSLPAFPDRWQQPAYFNSISCSHLFRKNTEGSFCYISVIRYQVKETFEKCHRSFVQILAVGILKISGAVLPCCSRWIKGSTRNRLTDWPTNSMERSISWEANSHSAGQKNSSLFMEPEGSLPCS
jgi:hypothetical protein